MQATLSKKTDPPPPIETTEGPEGSGIAVMTEETWDGPQDQNPEK